MQKKTKRKKEIQIRKIYMQKRSKIIFQKNMQEKDAKKVEGCILFHTVIAWMASPQPIL